MASEKIHVCIGLYDSLEFAEDDFADLKRLHEYGRLGAYDAAVLQRDGEQVKIVERVGKTKHGMWSGVGIGALVGVLLPPAVIGMAIAGGGIGALSGHFKRGLPKADIDEAGAALQFEAALIIVGDDGMAAQLERLLSRTPNRMAKTIDADPEAFTAALREAEEQRASSGGGAD